MTTTPVDPSMSRSEDARDCELWRLAEERLERFHAVRRCAFQLELAFAECERNSDPHMGDVKEWRWQLTELIDDLNQRTLNRCRDEIDGEE